MLKQLIKNVKEEKRLNGENYPSLSIELFDNRSFYELSKEEMRALLQEAIYLLRDKDQNTENELIAKIEEWHAELLEDDEEDDEEINEDFIDVKAIEEEEKQAIEETKEILKKRFNEYFKGYRLLAVQLDGFYHRIIFDGGSAKSEVIGLKFSNYMGKNEFLTYNTNISDKLYYDLANLFAGFSHISYQNNAKEIVYIRPEER